MLYLIVILALMAVLIGNNWGYGIVVGGLGWMIYSLQERIETLEERLQVWVEKERASTSVKKEPVVPPVREVVLPKEEVTDIPSQEQVRPQKPKPQTATQTLQSSTPKVTTKPISPQVEEVYPSFWERESVQKVYGAIYGWFMDGNTFVRIAIVVLFVGFALLFKEAYERGLIATYFPIELRLLSVAVFAFIMLYIGYNNREKRKTFGLLLQGGALGILYLTVYAALSLYGLISPLFAFVLFVVLSGFTLFLALSLESAALALFAVIGGFIAPILTSTGSNNYIGLFSFYALLNSVIFLVSRVRSWRLLNLVGFLFTFVVATVWGVKGGYQPEFFMTTEPFLLFFMLLYVGITIHFALLQDIKLKQYVDSTLLFGVPIVGFSLQAAMVKPFEYGLGISAFVLGVFYLLLSYFMFKRYKERLPLLAESFLAIGAIFLTLAIPFSLDGAISSVAWIAEGSAVVWVSLKQEQKYRRLFGVVVMLLGTIMMLHTQLSYSIPEGKPYLNGLLFAGIIAMVSLTLTAWNLYRHQDMIRKFERMMVLPLLVYGMVLLFGTVFQNVGAFSYLYASDAVYILFVGGVALLFYAILIAKMAFQPLVYVALLMFVPIMVTLIPMNHHSTGSELGLWGVLIALMFYILTKADRVILEAKSSLLVHIGFTLILMWLLFLAGVWVALLGMTLFSLFVVLIGRKIQSNDLERIALMLLPTMALSLGASFVLSQDVISLPSLAFAQLPIDYIGAFLWPFAFVVFFWLLNTHTSISTKLSQIGHLMTMGIIMILLGWFGNGVLLLGVTLLALLFNSVGKVWKWQEMRMLSIVLLPTMVLVTLWLMRDGTHPFVLEGSLLALGIENGYLLWTAAFAAFVILVVSWHKTGYRPYVLPLLLHVAVGLLVVLLTWEMLWHTGEVLVSQDAWFMALIPIFALLALAMISKIEFVYQALLRSGIGYILASLLAFWSVVALSHSGQSDLMGWLPLFNALDIMQLLIFVVLVAFVSSIEVGEEMKRNLLSIGFGFLFVWLNMMVLRSVSHWAVVPWSISEVFVHPYTQSALSIFWTLIGLGLTFFSTRKQKRILWIVGASLLAIVVFKLFAFDLHDSDKLVSTISFIAVGILLLLVGYFSPIPPKRKEDDIAVEKQ